MTETDPILARVEAFDREKGGGVTAYRSRGGHTLALTATDAPVAQLKRKARATGSGSSTGRIGTGGRMSETWAGWCCRSTKPSKPSPKPRSSGPGPDQILHKVQLRCSDRILWVESTAFNSLPSRPAWT